jgi:hypothetical protein
MDSAMVMVGRTAERRDVQGVHGEIALIATSSIVTEFAPAQQASAQEPLIHWHLMGGYRDALGATSNYLQGDYIFGGGIGLSPAWMCPLEMRFDLSFSEHNATITVLNNARQALNEQVDSGTDACSAAHSSTFCATATPRTVSSPIRLEWDSPAVR